MFEMQNKEWKFVLTRRLYERGYERQDRLNLFRFLDWLMELPEELKQTFRVELEQYERERQMRYITLIEQIMREEIRQEGRQEERRELALKMMRENVAIETVARITGLSLPSAKRSFPQKFNN